MTNDLDLDPLEFASLPPFAAHVLGWMKSRGISGREMAKRCGLSPSYFTTLRSGKTELPTWNTLRALSKVMGSEVMEFAPSMLEEETKKAETMLVKLAELSGRTQLAGAVPAEQPNAFHAPDVPTEALAAEIYMSLDVPVLGVSMGGDDTYFHFNGETVDYVRRPPGIAKAKRAYAAFVVGESMYPLYAEGSIVYVNPDKPPAIGDDVVLEVDMGPNEPTAGYIKRLKRRMTEKIVVEQFNPQREIEFDRAIIVAMHRVVPWNELLGI